MNFAKRHATLNGVMQLYAEAFETVGHDHRIGQLHTEYLAVLKAVYNYQQQHVDDLEVQQLPAAAVPDYTFQLSNEAREMGVTAPMAPGEEGNVDAIPRLPLAKEEENGLQWVHRKPAPESYMSVRTRVHLGVVREAFKQATKVPHGHLDRLLRNFESVEELAAGGLKGALHNCPDAREVYGRCNLAKGAYEKLAVMYQQVDTLAEPEEGRKLR